MTTPDDQSIERTREEAERLLKELDRPPIDPDSRVPPSRNFPSDPASTSAPAGQSAVPTSWLLLAALVFGTVLSALLLLLLIKAPGPKPATTELATPAAQPSPAETNAKSPGLTTDSTPPREVPSKEQTPQLTAPAPEPEAQPRGAWGPASAYKFERLPDATYPDNCAFSQTDASAKFITSRSEVDYWACRDEGGNPTDGFSIVWADGKRTKYLFGSAGQGSVVGTNGVSYPIAWSNGSRNGTNVIIISHSDGATSWIPGKVN